MARIGITYQAVAETALQLLAQGRNPTVESVRVILGTGSSTTIANHLRQWKANQEANTNIGNKENIPGELVSVMKGLWERVSDHSQEQVATIEKNLQKDILELHQDLEKYKKNNRRWQKLFTQWQQIHRELVEEKITLEQALRFSHHEKIALQTKQESYLQQLQEKQAHIDELHQLHRQTQTNLEHYRQSVCELDKQKQQMDTEIKKIHQQWLLECDKKNVLQQELNILKNSYETLEKMHSQNTSQIANIQLELKNVEKESLKQSEESKHWQNHSQKVTQDLEIKNNQLIEMQIINKHLTKEISDLKSSLQHTLKSNKQMTNEKLKMAQEKIQLEKRIKQMQKIVG